MYRLLEPDDLLCDYCALGSKRYRDSIQDESCVDCTAHSFGVQLPMTGLFEGFWGRDYDRWRTEKTPYELVPGAAHEWGAPYPWETWIEEAPIREWAWL